MSAPDTLSTKHVVERRRRALESLIERYDRSPQEQKQILGEIQREQQRLNIYKRGTADNDDVLGWVDTWKPRRPRKTVMQSLFAAL